MKKEPRQHCSIHISVTSLTGEKRQLSEQEIATRLEKILSIPPDERIRMYSPVARKEDTKQ